MVRDCCRLSRLWHDDWGKTPDSAFATTDAPRFDLRPVKATQLRGFPRYAFYCSCWRRSGCQGGHEGRYDGKLQQGIAPVDLEQFKSFLQYFIHVKIPFQGFIGFVILFILTYSKFYARTTIIVIIYFSPTNIFFLYRMLHCGRNMSVTINYTIWIYDCLGCTSNYSKNRAK